MPKRIETGTPQGDALGFSADLFFGWLELYEDCRLYLYYLESQNKNQGNTQCLLRRWISKGYDLRIIRPSSIMQHILHKFGFEPFQEYLPEHYQEEVEVWRRPASLHTVRYTSLPVFHADSD